LKKNRTKQQILRNNSKKYFLLQALTIKFTSQRRTIINMYTQNALLSN